jgi:hypothetical protein
MVATRINLRWLQRILRVTIHVGGFFRAAGPASNRGAGQASVPVALDWSATLLALLSRGLAASRVLSINQSEILCAREATRLRDCFHVPIGASQIAQNCHLSATACSVLERPLAFAPVDCNCHCQWGSSANLETRSRARSEPRSLAFSYQVRASARSGMISSRGRNSFSAIGS